MSSPTTVSAVRGLVAPASSPPSAVQIAIDALRADRPGRQGAGDAVLGSLFEPVGGEHRAVQAHADDDRELDRHHRHQADDARPDEGQADQPDGAQRADDPKDPLPAVAGHDTARPAATRSSPPTQGAAKARPYCQGANPELAEQEHGQQRLGGHDQPADEQLVEIERAQSRMGEDVPPAVEQLAGPEPARSNAAGVLLAADRRDARAESR